ncbi:hypothetical protein QVD17_08730 [Tagetes erecta]|uniref:Uncharacterized protein n=1 Tax=Tagetes erecta TaxID=13708 RepID=A0AAD8P4Q9_TARER|nr:hypothetical protein QVD17_08730 [Tagetes erecta]
MSTLFFEKKHNMCALLDENFEKASSYRDAIIWLKSSHIHHAISHSPTIYETHVRDFWRTAVMNVSVQPSRICANVCGHDLAFTEADLARILRLEDDMGEEVHMSAEEVYGAFRTAGYEGPMPGEKKMEFVKSYLIQEWRYIAHVFIMCLDHRKGGTDGLNLDWARAMMLFCRGQKANLAKLIYNYILENIHASKGAKWLMYPRFIQMILNDKLPNLPVEGAELEIWDMHPRIFKDCKSVRADCVGRTSFLWENMYPAERWVQIQRLIESERKRGGENIEVIEKKIRKRKAYAKDKNYSFEREVDEIQAEIDAGRELRTKKRADTHAEGSKKAKHDVGGTYAGSGNVLKDEVEKLKVDLAELTSKHEELEKQDAEKSTVIYEMGRMMKDQQCLLVRIFKELNDLKKNVGSEPAMTEAELNSLTDITRYPLMDVDFGDKGKAVEEEFDEEMGINMDVFEGEEVVGGSGVDYTLVDEPEADFDAGSEEDIEDEPEIYKVEEKGMSYQFEHAELDKSEWFRKEEAVVPEVPIFQHLDEPTTKQQDRQIIAWKYNCLVEAYMIKRRGGDITYVKNRKHFATFPRWDLRRLAELPLLGKEDSGRACAFEAAIREAAKSDFVEFGYQKPKRMRQKKDKHWVSWKGKIVLKIDAPKVMTRVRVPDTQPPRLQDFSKWFYDNSTGEAIIRLSGDDRPEIRLFDPMEVFSFCDEDLKVLCEHRIKHGAGDDTAAEANLFVKVANKARGIRAELKEVNERLRRTDDLKLEMDDLTRQLDRSIEQRFEKPAEVIDLEVASEEQIAEIQAETTVHPEPDTEVAETEFVDSMLNLSEDEAGIEDYTNPMAGIKERAGAFIEQL